MEKEKVIRTNGIPQCPFCKKPTERTGGHGRTTLAYYKPHYDKNGVNTNPDRNATTSYWICLECGKEYTTAENPTDGYVYK